MIKKTLFKSTTLLLICAVVAMIFQGCSPGVGENCSSDTGADTVSGIEMPDYIYTPDADSTPDSSTPDNSTPGNSTPDSNEPSNSEGTSSPGDTSSGDANDDPFSNIPKSLRGTTVTIAHWGDEGASEYVKVAQQFTKDTGINVKWVPYNQGEYVSSVVKQIAVNSGPDIVILNNTFPTAIEMVQPLPDYFDLDDGFWDKRVSEALSVNGKYYFVNSYNSPFTGGTVVYYNKKIFNDNGLLTPQDYYDQGQWSYENLEKCMQQVTKLGYNGGIIESMVIAEQMGSSLIQYDKATGTFTGNATDDNLVAALQFMASAVEQGIAGGYTTNNFASGQVGICMSGTFGLKYNGVFKDMSPSEIGVVPLPNSFQGIELKCLPLGLRGCGFAKGAKNVQGAYYFLRYFLDYNRYEKAGAEIFANKVLEKYFVEVQLPLFKKSDLYFEYYQTPLNLVGRPWSGADWTAVRHAATGQVAVELEKMSNICDNAAAAANDKLNSVK